MAAGLKASGLLLLCVFALVACDDGSVSDQQDEGVAQPAVVDQPGKQIYQKWCISCHLKGVSSAPRLARPEDWTERLQRGRSGLIQSTIQGLGAMPPRGLCRSCSDEELAQAVDYMLGTLPEKPPG